MRGLCEALPGLISSFLPKDDEYSVIWALRNFGGDPFVLLVSIVLSQNTSDSNAIRALRNLLERGLTSPQRVLSSSDEELVDAVRVAGQYSSRVKTLRELARFFVSNPGFVVSICRDVGKTREALLGIRGVGEKTADVFLSVYCEASSVFPVDRHIMRITSRVLGRKVSYREASDFWLSCARSVGLPSVYKLHVFLIDMGRRLCRPRDPHCPSCPFRNHCSYALLHHYGPAASNEPGFGSQ